MKLGYIAQHNDFIFFLRLDDWNLHDRIKKISYTNWVFYHCKDNFWDLIHRGSVAIGKEDKIFLAELK